MKIFIIIIGNDPWKIFSTAKWELLVVTVLYDPLFLDNY